MWNPKRRSRDIIKWNPPKTLLTEIAQSMLKIVNDNILYAREVHKS